MVNRFVIYWYNRCHSMVKNMALVVHFVGGNHPKLGRKPKNVDEKQRRADNAAARDAENRRGEIERSFAFIKQKCGLGLVRAKTAERLRSPLIWGS